MTKYLHNWQSNYEFIMKNDKSGIQLRMKTFGAILFIDWFNKRIFSHDLNLLDQ